MLTYAAGEAMLPSLRTAAAHVLAAGGQTIPCRAEVHAMLVRAPLFRSQGRVNDRALCGVVLASVVTLVPQDPYLCEYLREAGHVALSEPFCALSVPFGRPSTSSSAGMLTYADVC